MRQLAKEIEESENSGESLTSSSTVPSARRSDASL